MAEQLKDLKKGDVIMIETSDANTGKRMGYIEYTVENNYKKHIEYREGDSEYITVARHRSVNDWFKVGHRNESGVVEIVEVVEPVEGLLNGGTFFLGGILIVLICMAVMIVFKEEKEWLFKKYYQIKEKIISYF